MNKTGIIIVSVIVLVVALLVGGVMYIKQYTPEYYWRPNYKYDNDQPYGTKYLYELLKDSYSDDEFHLLQKKPSAIIDEEETNSLLFYIGYNTFYDSVTVDWFKEYLLKGNKICIASDVLPFQLINEIYELDTLLFYTDTIISKTVNTAFDTTSSVKYNFHHQFIKDTVPFTWRYFSETTMTHYWKNYLYEPISTIEKEKVNFLRIDYGQGNLFVFTTPLFLTNYFFITEDGFDYANEFFANLGDFNSIYWDDFSRLPGRNPGGSSINKNNPLEFILENPALRWTWYLFLLGIALFAIFKLKRRQKPIEIITPVKNTSIEYTKAVGLLHYKTSDHTDLANRLMKIFQHYISSKYGIAKHLEKEEQIKQLTLHSGLPSKRIESIYKSHFNIKFNPDPEVSNTIQLHSNLEYFYKNCK